MVSEDYLLVPIIGILTWGLCLSPPLCLVLDSQPLFECPVVYLLLFGAVVFLLSSYPVAQLLFYCPLVAAVAHHMKYPSISGLSSFPLRAIN